MNDVSSGKSFKELIANSRPHQLVAIGLLVALCVAGLLALVAGASFSVFGGDAASNTAPSAKSTDSFHPTPGQWAALKIAPVVQTVFHSEQMTDGKIAIDDDTMTPVFSPYSGRVIKLVAKAGDVVKQNDPLFTIEATEFIQAANDLIAAASALKNAKAQLSLAH